MNVYIASAWKDHPTVRAMHIAIRALGHTPTSTWAETARGELDDLDMMTDDDVEAQWHVNHEAAADADIVIVRADSGGRETFAEAHTALMAGCKVVWVGRETLSARRFGQQVKRVTSDAEAIAWLANRSDTLPPAEAVAS